jgi:hypothetical protein
VPVLLSLIWDVVLVIWCFCHGLSSLSETAPSAAPPLSTRRTTCRQHRTP